MDPATGDVWLSERAAPNHGAGRLDLITRLGSTITSVTGIEPYGIDVDPIDGSCWVSDLRSNRILQISRTGATVRVSPLLATPYAVRVGLP